MPLAAPGQSEGPGTGVAYSGAVRPQDPRENSGDVPASLGSCGGERSRTERRLVESEGQPRRGGGRYDRSRSRIRPHYGDAVALASGGSRRCGWPRIAGCQQGACQSGAVPDERAAVLRHHSVVVGSPAKSTHTAKMIQSKKGDGTCGARRRRHQQPGTLPLLRGVPNQAASFFGNA